MQHAIRMPKLGLTMDEGEVLEWHVTLGEQVVEGDHLVTIWTDKAEVAISSTSAGRVTEIHAQAGDLRTVGEVLCVIEE